MKTRGLSGWVAGALATLASACAAEDRDVDRAVGPMDVTSVTDHVVFVDHGRNEALLLDVSRSSPPASASIVPLVTNPIQVVSRLKHPDQVLVLSLGQPDDGVAPPEKPGLAIVDARGKNRTFRYDSAFDALAQSDDGRSTLLYFTSGAGGGGVLFNPNEVAILDLDKTDAPQVLTPRPLGGTIQHVAFSPPDFAIDGVPRRLAVTLFDKYLNILDLDHLALSEFSVELAPAKSNAIRLSQVLFSSTESKVYVLATGTDNVFVVTLSPRTPSPSEPKQNDFSPSVTQFPAGTGPTDLALFDDGNKHRLLVASPGSSEIVVGDSDSNNVTNVPLGAPGNKILLFSGTSPTDAVVAPRALIYTPGSSVVSFVDLAKLTEEGTRNVERRDLSEAYSDAIPLDAHTVMLPHVGTGLSLLNLSERTIGIISGPNLKGAVSDEAVNKLWLAHGNKVGYLDLTKDSHPNEVRVDAVVDALVTVPSKTPKVVVTHAYGTGWATVLDAKDPNDLAAAYSMRGFFLDGVLQGGG
jgi:hypothetical protein